MDKREQRERLSEILHQVGLQDHKDKLPGQLSGGQQQRVALARAMVTRPDIILFDEPLSNLDAKMREGVRFEIKELQRQHNLTSIYVTHDQAEALAMSDRIIVLNRGEIEQIGTPEDIYFRPTSRFVADFIGAANIHTAFVEANDTQDHYRVTCDMGEFDIESEVSPSGDNIYVCWRPEDACVCEEGAPNSFALSVNSVAFQGDTLSVFGWVGALKEHKVRVQLAGRLSVKAGDVLHIQLPNHGIRFLEEVEA